jgi:flagellar basal body-associated protein FliL
MSDEEKFLEEDVAAIEEEDSQEKAGFVPGILLVVLKWGAIGLAFIVLVVTISWATFNLFIKGKTSSVAPDYSSTQEKVQIPMEFYSNQLDNIRGRTADVPSKTFMAAFQIGYEKGNTQVQTELIEKTEIIRNEILKYLGSKTENDLSTTNFEKIENEIKSRINLLMTTGLVKQVLIHELQVF